MPVVISSLESQREILAAKLVTVERDIDILRGQESAIVEAPIDPSPALHIDQLLVGDGSVSYCTEKTQ